MSQHVGLNDRDLGAMSLQSLHLRNCQMGISPPNAIPPPLPIISMVDHRPLRASRHSLARHSTLRPTLIAFKLLRLVASMTKRKRSGPTATGVSMPLRWLAHWTLYTRLAAIANCLRCLSSFACSRFFIFACKSPPCASSANLTTSASSNIVVTTP